MQLMAQTYIRGAFHGWSGDAVYELGNGTAWKLAHYQYHYFYAYQPQAKLWMDGGQYLLEVAGMGKPVEVRGASAPHGNTPIPLFHWNGAYFGFISRGYIFGSSGHCLGWLDDELQVWHGNGRFSGELVEENYVLRNLARSEPSPRTPMSPSLPVVPIVPPIPRIPHVPRPGWRDALGE